MTTIDFQQLHEATFDVAVVGLGPVGITLCNLLGRMGVSVLGIDARDEIFPLPRAIGMDHDVMRVFQGVGIADELSSVVGDYKDSEYRAADGSLLRKFVSPSLPHQLGWPPYLTFVQPPLERILRDKAANTPGISIMTGVELAALENPGAPTLSLKEMKTRETASIKPTYVVGCDGGNSFVRQTLGIGFEDLVFDQPWLVIDVVLGDEPVELPQVNVQYCNPARPHTFVVLPGNLRRWEFMLLPGETAEEVNQPDRIWQLLSPWLDRNQAEIWRSATYRFHALVAEKWRDGNVFLAGDACHMTPPFLAQGMVQGIKDTSNLAWKISHALKNSSPRLLDTYEQERRPLVHKVISITKTLGEVICEIDEERAVIRNTEMKMLVDEGKGTVVRQSLFPPITDGAIGRTGSGNTMRGAGEAGPQPRVQTEKAQILMDDLLGHKFAILTYGLKVDMSVREKAQAIDMAVLEFGDKGTLTEEHSVLKNWLSDRKALALVMRPDRVVFGTAASESELSDLVEQVEAWLA